MEWNVLNISDLKKDVSFEEEIASILSEHFKIQRSQFCLKRTKWKKPYMDLKSSSKVYFNYSHTKNKLLIGFSDCYEIGVDIEEICVGINLLD